MIEQVQELEKLYADSKSASWIVKAKIADEAMKLSIGLIRALVERVQQLEEQCTTKTK